MAILIIGGKYGSPATTNNNEFDEYVSVTRKEFRSANRSKILIYTLLTVRYLPNMNYMREI